MPPQGKAAAPPRPNKDDPAPQYTQTGGDTPRSAKSQLPLSLSSGPSATRAAVTPTATQGTPPQRQNVWVIMDDLKAYADQRSARPIGEIVAYIQNAKTKFVNYHPKIKHDKTYWVSTLLDCLDSRFDPWVANFKRSSDGTELPTLSQIAVFIRQEEARLLSINEYDIDISGDMVNTDHDNLPAPPSPVNLVTRKIDLDDPDHNVPPAVQPSPVTARTKQNDQEMTYDPLPENKRAERDLNASLIDAQPVFGSDDESDDDR